MYLITKSIDIDFAHHIRGHAGACINIHGHTWRFEVGVSADELDAQGFVVDFAVLKKNVLRPCHQLLDHSLAVGADTYDDIAAQLEPMGVALLESRRELHGRIDTLELPHVELEGAETRFPGGMKIAVFPFNPTSERISEWLYRVTAKAVQDDRVRVDFTRVYETQRPTDSIAEYRPSR
ncbi:MAG: 6-carboxytetrahydropterin synthase [Deltaproteobacteria bacterium]